MTPDTTHTDREPDSPTDPALGLYETDGEYFIHHDRDAPGTLTATVAHALAAAAQVDLSQAERSLYDCVDPQALNLLFRPTDDDVVRDGRLRVQALGYEIDIRGTGEVHLTPLDPRR